MTDTGRKAPPRVIHFHQLPPTTDAARRLVAAWRTTDAARNLTGAFQDVTAAMVEGTRASLTLTVELHRWAVLKRCQPITRAASARKRARALKWRTTKC